MRDEFPKTASVSQPPLSLVTAASHQLLGEDVDESGERPAIGQLGSVLLVEADPDQQWRLARDLTRAGARVVGTSSGDGALALVSEWKVDVVLIADELPGMDGYEVCRRIGERRPDVQLFMMSDLTSPSVDAASRAVGAQCCLTKPIDLPSLATKMAQAAAPDLELFEP